ncbi:peptidase E [Sanguibacter sp. HDW7]|uniref:Type 1 glutamine amidotransferase-like domain-containing protein n=1 Tax=Sanguibacter sp. HDW7 TaxID=2714931 RepID=UPI001F1147BF|nr:peptidase E [Sanguibacter sp. HDW7]
MTTILTLGGGGHTMPHVHGLPFSPIDELALELTGKDRPAVCYVGTAGGDEPGPALRFREVFADVARPTVLTLFNREEPDAFGTDAIGPGDLERILEQDLVYVGGGSTANLLALWRLHGLDLLLAEAAERGTVLVGVSAGGNCWFEGSSTGSFGPLRPLGDGLGLLPGSNCPHYGGEPGRREGFEQAVASGVLPDGYGVDDGGALLWRDGVLVEAVAETASAGVVRVRRTPDGSVSEPVAVRRLV